jgi:O-antigen ligase
VGLKESLARRSISLIQPQEDMATGSSGARLLVWRESLAMLKDHPVLGVGAGNWRILVQKYGFYRDYKRGAGTDAPDRAHNVYLQVALKRGARPGLIPGWLVSHFSRRLQSNPGEQIG